jgi:PAS domain S-box-containing protein
MFNPLLERLAAPLALLTVFQRMALFSLLGLLSMLAVSIAPFLAMDRLIEANQRFEQRHLAAALISRELKEAHLLTRMTLLDVLHATDPQQRSAFALTLGRLDERYSAALARLRERVPELSRPLAEIEAGHATRVRTREAILQLAEGGLVEQALVAAYDPARLQSNEQWMAQLDSLTEHIGEQVREAAAELRQAHDTDARYALWRIAFGFLVFIGLSLLFTSSIAIPLRRLRDKTVALAEGQYEIEIPYGEQRNEIGEMAQALLSLKQVSLELEDKRWVKDRLMTFLSALQQTESLEAFGNTLLAHLCPAVGAAQGLLYVDHDSNGHLLPVGAYGCTPNGPPFACSDGRVVPYDGDGTRPTIDSATESRQPGPVLPDMAQHDTLLLPLTELSLSSPQPRSCIGLIELALLNAPDNRRKLLLDELPAALTPLLEVLRRNLRYAQFAEEIGQQAAELIEQKEELLQSDALQRQANSLLNKILAAATEIGVISTDFNGTVTTFNVGAERLLGWTTQEMVGHKTPTCFHLAEEVDAAAAVVRAQFGCNVRGVAFIVGGAATRGRDSQEWTFVRKDGSRFPGLEIITTIDPGDGVTTGFLIILQDISVRRELEEEMLRARRLAEEASLIKSAFLANMSHEIRTPMNAIIGFTHLALNSELTPLQRDYLNKIQLSGDHLLGVINDILDVSRIEAGKLDVEHVEFELATTLAGVESLIGGKAREKGLELVCNVADDVPISLVGDPLRLTQVLINYANNALKFTERGEISIVVRVLERSEESVLLRFAVRDTGIGLSEEQCGRLFTAFTQADASTTRKYGGSGLGLTISKRLAELMGGEVGVDSVPGQGSTFWFTARLGVGQARPHGSGAAEQASAAAPAARLEKLATIAGARILVVEDNEFNQQVARELLLQAADVSVDLAENGRVALSRLQAHDYDLVLMDMQMPVMDGIAATRALRRLPRTAALPVVAMTANALAADRQRCLDAGMNDFLAKPIEPKRLWPMLLKWIPARTSGTVQPVAISAATSVTLLENSQAALPPPAPAFDLGIADLNSGPAHRRLLGNTALYLNSLRMFCNPQENMIEKVRIALDSDDWGGAQRQAHTLKSVLATLGADRLALSAAELEQALGERPLRSEINPRIDALALQLSELSAAVRAKLPELSAASTPATVILPAAACAAAIDELEMLLAASNPEVLDWLESNPGALHSFLPTADVTKIEAAIRAFELDDALLLLHAVKNKGRSSWPI